MCDLLRSVKRDLRAAGHTADFTAKTQTELHCDVARIKKLIAATPADAWVLAPAPREVQEFFAAQSVPVIGIGEPLRGCAHGQCGCGCRPRVSRGHAAARRARAPAHRDGMPALVAAARSREFWCRPSPMNWPRTGSRRASSTCPTTNPRPRACRRCSSRSFAPRHRPRSSC